jgi:hypothetical protein
MAKRIVPDPRAVVASLSPTLRAAPLVYTRLATAPFCSRYS